MRISNGKPSVWNRRWRRPRRPIVLVANEVGSGIVPDHPLGRKFRDLQGLLNQRIAARADHVVLMVAGLPLAMKGALKETT